jgi:hypothetical protein
MAAPRSVRRGHTIQQLRALRAEGWHNPDTGTELQPGESDDALMRMEQNRADKEVAKRLKAMNTAISGMKKRSNGRAWINNPEFRTIKGNRVPFAKGTFEAF